MEFFGVSNPTQVFLEIGRNYVSITITIISNITDYCVSVTQCYIPWMFYAYEATYEAFYAYEACL